MNKPFEMLIIAISRKKIGHFLDRIRSDRCTLVYLVDRDERIQKHYNNASEFWKYKKVRVRTIDSVDEFNL